MHLRRLLLGGFAALTVFALLPQVRAEGRLRSAEQFGIVCLLHIAA